MSTQDSTAFQVDPARDSVRRSSRAEVLAMAAAGVVAVGLVAGVMWRPTVVSYDSWRAADTTSVATLRALEPTSAGKATAAPMPEAASLGALASGSDLRAQAQTQFAPWSESATPVSRSRGEAKQPGTPALRRVREPQTDHPSPQVAPWRPIQPRTARFEATQPASEPQRDDIQTSQAGDPRGDFSPPVAAEMPHHELPPRPSACHTCGVVEAVRPVQQGGQPSGLGAIAGGVAGGLLGNQIGQGNGRSTMTVLGAIGGGLAGHEVEKRVRGTTVYEVRVRMEDGSRRTLQQRSSPATGSRVRIDGDRLRPLQETEPREFRNRQDL